MIIAQAELPDGLFAQSRAELVEQGGPAGALALRIIKKVSLEDLRRLKFRRTDDDLGHGRMPRRTLQLLPHQRE